MDTALPSQSNSGPSDQDPTNQDPTNHEKLLGEFVAEQLEARLRKAAFELRNVRQTMEQEGVHDLRVALRRLMESVRVAKGVLPKEGAERVMEDLGEIMKDAGRVRSCDIAADLLRAAGAPADAPALLELGERRRTAEHKLYEQAHHAYQRNATMKWRKALGLGAREPGADD